MSMRLQAQWGGGVPQCNRKNKYYTSNRILRDSMSEWGLRISNGE